MQLTLGMMEAARAGPAVRATEDRGVAECGTHTLQFARGQVERVVPGHLHELVVAPCACTRSVGQPSAADVRMQDPRTGVE